MKRLKVKDGFEKVYVDLRGYYFYMVNKRIYELPDNDAKYILDKYGDYIDEVGVSQREQKQQEVVSDNEQVEDKKPKKKKKKKE